MLFYVTIRYKEPIEGTDNLKTITAKYVVDAVSITDSEAKIVAWMPKNFQDTEILGSVQASNLSEVIAVDFDEAVDTFYIGRASYLEDAENKPKKKNTTFMVNASPGDLEEALTNAKVWYDSIQTVDYKLESIATCKIVCDSDLVKMHEFSTTV